MIDSDLAAEIESLHKLIEELTKRVSSLEASTTDLSEVYRND
jgi:prefoldin subunit 5